MAKPSRRYCLCCNKLIQPDARNSSRQKYCRAPECRKASKAASQRKWLDKPENKHYFSGPVNVDRVQRWRKQNPGYTSRSSKSPGTLQEVINPEEVEQQRVIPKSTQSALQDLLVSQDLIILGLISVLVDSPLQETIADSVLQLISRGRDILGMEPEPLSKGQNENQKTSSSSTSSETSAATVQLGRSQAGSSG